LCELGQFLLRQSHINRRTFKVPNAGNAEDTPHTMIDNACNEGNQHSDAEVASNTNTRSKTKGQRNDTAAKSASLKDTLNNPINNNTCCMCFGNYEEDV